MTGVIEQLNTLRSVVVDGSEKQLKLLLQNAGYNVERAINHYFEGGLPDVGPLPTSERTRLTKLSPPSENNDSMGLPTSAVAPASTNSHLIDPAKPSSSPAWPKLAGERWVTGYSTRRGSLAFRERVAIVCEGSASHLTTATKAGIDAKGRFGKEKQVKRAKSAFTPGPGKHLGRVKSPSTSAMSHILFRGAVGGLEGRLPGEVCAFLAPLLNAGLARVSAEAVCELSRLGIFAEVPLSLSIEVYEELFNLDPVEDDELYRSAFSLLQFAHTGCIDQEQPKPSQPLPSQGTQAAVPVGSERDGRGVIKFERRVPSAEVTARRIGESEASAEGLDDREPNGERQEAEEDGEKEVRDEDVKELYDDEIQLCQMPEARDPRLFVDGLKLRRYQRQALAWMIQRERRCYISEDRDALSLGVTEGLRGHALGNSQTGSAQSEASVEDTFAMELGRNGDEIYLKHGVIHVAAWEAPGADSGGGEGVVLHPLWERRAVASIVGTPAKNGGPPPPFLNLVAQADGESATSAGSGNREFSHPEVFFVNVYSRRFQREFPPASLRSRGGILADEMGMGKTVMLLSLILCDKEGEAKVGDEEPTRNVTTGDRGGDVAHGAHGSRERRNVGGVNCVVHEDGVSGSCEPEERLESKVDAGTDRCPDPIASKDVTIKEETAPGEREVGAPMDAPKRRRRKVEEGRVAGAIPADSRRKRRLRSAGSAAATNGAPAGKRPKTRARVAKGKGADCSGGIAGNGGHLDWSDEEVCHVEPSSPSPAFLESETGNSSSSSDEESDYAPGSAESEAASEDEVNVGARDPDSNLMREEAEHPRAPAHRVTRRERVSPRRKDQAGQQGGGEVGFESRALSEDPAPVESSRSNDIVEVVGCISPPGDSNGRGNDDSHGGTKRSSAPPEGGTLVVCPLSMIGQWRGELESKTRKGALAVSFHYGTGRNRSIRDLCRFDVVLTTYGTVSSDMMKREADVQALGGLNASGGGGTKKRPNAGLLGLRWKRIILDEAHTIRNTLTDQSRACLLLEAERRWAVTGTPIQNSLDDAAALLAFLRHEPWSDRGWWRKVIGDPYKAGDMEAIRRLKTVLGPIMLRRTKGTLDAQGRPIVELPPKEVEIVRLEFNPVEREFYEALKHRSQLEFDGYLAAGTVMKSYIAILTLLLRLRQACNHPFLVLGRAPAGASEPLTLDHGTSRKHTGGSASRTVVAEPLDMAREAARPSVLPSECAGEIEESTKAGGRDGGKIPRYVQELYRRFRERTAAQERAQFEEVVDTTGTEEIFPGGAAGGDEEGDVKEASRRSESRAFLDSVVGQLRDDGGTVTGECPVCLEEPMSVPALTPCAHLLCRRCLEDCLRREACCPVCRVAMNESDIIDLTDRQEERREDHSARDGESSSVVESVHGPAETRARGQEARKSARGRRVVKLNLGGEGPNGWVGSTKLTRLEVELKEMRRKRPGAKAVVFSQWTHMLDLAETCLARAGWKLRRLDGTMPQQRRESALKSFATDVTVTVMLVSLKAGGVGLNLTAASTVILLDPWWNPAVEDQAIDRIHRLGQVNEVSVKRFVVSGTVEDKMLALQEVKGRMAKNALASGSLGEDRKLRVEDLIQFFK